MRILFTLMLIVFAIPAQSAFSLCAVGSSCIRGTCPTSGCGAGLECRQITGGDAACVPADSNPNTNPTCADINCGAAECRMFGSYPTCFGNQSVSQEPEIVTPAPETCATTRCGIGLVCVQEIGNCGFSCSGLSPCPPCRQPAPQCVPDPNAQATCATSNPCSRRQTCRDTSTGPACFATHVQPTGCAALRCGFGATCQETAGQARCVPTQTQNPTFPSFPNFENPGFERPSFPSFGDIRRGGTFGNTGFGNRLRTLCERRGGTIVNGLCQR